MRKDIRTKSLNETQLENEAKISYTVYQIIGVAIFLALMNLAFNLTSFPIEWDLVILNGLMIMVIGYFIIKIRSVRNNIKRIEGQIKKMSHDD